MWFKKKIRLTEEEQDVFDMIQIMCNNTETDARVDTSNMDYYLSNKAQHYDVIITSTTIHVTNTVSNDHTSHREDFIDHCKDLVELRITSDLQSVKDGMLARRRNMFAKMKDNLTPISGNL